MLKNIEFIHLTERDIKCCELLEQSFPEEFAKRGCAFWIQQAVEKQMKAIIAAEGLECSKTHDIQKRI